MIVKVDNQILTKNLFFYTKKILIKICFDKNVLEINRIEQFEKDISDNPKFL